MKCGSRFTAILTLAFLGCVPVDFQGEGGSQKHGGGGSKGEGFMSSLFGGRSGGSGGSRAELEMQGIALIGAKGRWPAHVNELTKKEIAAHPNLIHGIEGKGNPLAGICDNYLSLTVAQRENVLLKVAPSLAYGESHFGFSGNGGERSSYRRSYGPFQISHGAESWGCWVGGYKPRDWRANLDCVFKVMDGLYTRRGLPIANNETYWSVLRPNKFLVTRFMPTFSKLAPECKRSVASRPTKSFPGASFAGGTNSEKANAG